MAKRKKKGFFRRLIKWLIFLVILAILGVLFYYVWYPMLKASVTTTYDIYQATTGTISNSLSFSGSVSVINSGYLYPSENATVRDIYIKDGSDVKAGERVMRLSNGEYVKAEFDGTVNTLNVEVGDNVNNNTQLCQIVDFANMKVTMRVDEYDISEVYVGQACTVSVTALEKSFDSTISHINRLSSSSGSVAYYTVTATVEVTEDVYPGMQVTVRIPKEEAKDVVVLKMDALSFDAFNNAFVYVMNEEGAMEICSVEVGVDNGNYVQIVSGLESGDTVYVETEEEVTASSGLQGLFSSIMGGNNTQINPSSMMGGGGFSGFGGGSSGGGGQQRSGGGQQRGGAR